MVGPVTFDPGRRAFSVTARGPHPGRGKMPVTVSGTGEDEIAALVDLHGRLTGADRPVEDPAKRALLNRRLRQAFYGGAEEEAADAGRALTGGSREGAGTVSGRRVIPTLVWPQPLGERSSLQHFSAASSANCAARKGVRVQIPAPVPRDVSAGRQVRRRAGDSPQIRPRVPSGGGGPNRTASFPRRCSLGPPISSEEAVGQGEPRFAAEIAWPA